MNGCGLREYYNPPIAKHPFRIVISDDEFELSQMYMTNDVKIKGSLHLLYDNTYMMIPDVKVIPCKYVKLFPGGYFELYNDPRVGDDDTKLKYQFNPAEYLSAVHELSNQSLKGSGQ
jgi:hypothetical protein